MLSRRSNGNLLTPREFDRAEFADGWRYELINGVLIVSPIPSQGERGPNDALGHWLNTYRDQHPEGGCMDSTVFEHTVDVGANRRRADRAIWIGLGRLPRRADPPTIVVEFVSRRKRDRRRDYLTKRDEYLAAHVKEYWVIDRFDRCLVVFTKQGGKARQRAVTEKQVYKTPLLPGFELPLAKLLALADAWHAAERER